MNTIDLNEKTSDPNTDLIKCTASLVAAYVSRNAVGVGDLPVLIDQVHTAISVLQGGGSGSGPVCRAVTKPSTGASALC